MTELRKATTADIPALQSLIDVSVRELSRGYYSDEQIASALRHVFGPDTQLIADGTYYVIPAVDGFAASGGWSRRRTLYGGDQMKGCEDPLLDPVREPARIRAFYVHPAWARRGLGRRLLEHCSGAAREAGFQRLELMATLPGVPLYSAMGFIHLENTEPVLPDGVKLPMVHMSRSL